METKAKRLDVVLECFQDLFHLSLSQRTLADTTYSTAKPDSFSARCAAAFCTAAPLRTAVAKLQMVKAWTAPKTRQVVSVTKWGLCRRASSPNVAIPLPARLPWLQSGIRRVRCLRQSIKGVLELKGGEIMAAASSPKTPLNAARQGSRGPPPCERGRRLQMKSQDGAI